MHAAHQEGQQSAPADDASQLRQTEVWKRLPGLWIICVLVGSMATLFVTLAFLALPMRGKAVFGFAALILYAIGLGLWIRSNVARITVVALMAVWSVFIVALWALAGFDSGAAGPAILRISVALVICTYLCLSGRCFSGSARQRLRLRGVWGLLAIFAALFAYGAMIFLSWKSYGPQLDSYVQPGGGFLGVEMRDVPARPRSGLGSAEPQGVIVHRVVRGSPAEAAGLKADDVITAYGGRAVARPEALVRMVRRTSPGTQIEIRFVRAGRQESVVVIIGTRVIDLQAPPREHGP